MDLAQEYEVVVNDLGGIDIRTKSMHTLAGWIRLDPAQAVSLGDWILRMYRNDGGRDCHSIQGPPR